MKIGFGTWDGEAVRDPRWRSIVERIDDAGRPDEERLRLARRVLRDGNDLTRCMLFEVFCRAQMDTRWGVENPFRTALSAMRVQAIHVLRGDGGPGGRYHAAAMALLKFAPRPRDVDLLLRHLRARSGPPGLRDAALSALANVTKELWPAQIEDLLAWAAGAVLDPTLDFNELHHLSIALEDCPDPRAADLLERAIHARWASDAAALYGASLVRRAPARGRPLGERLAAATADVEPSTYARSELRRVLDEALGADEAPSEG